MQKELLESVGMAIDGVDAKRQIETCANKTQLLDQSKHTYVDNTIIGLADCLKGRQLLSVVDLFPQSA